MKWILQNKFSFSSSMTHIFLSTSQWKAVKSLRIARTHCTRRRYVLTHRGCVLYKQHPTRWLDIVDIWPLLFLSLSHLLYLSLLLSIFLSVSISISISISHCLSHTHSIHPSLSPIFHFIRCHGTLICQSAAASGEVAALLERYVTLQNNWRGMILTLLA